MNDKNKHTQSQERSEKTKVVKLAQSKYPERQIPQIYQLHCIGLKLVINIKSDTSIGVEEKTITSTALNYKIYFPQNRNNYAGLYRQHKLHCY